MRDTREYYRRIHELRHKRLALIQTMRDDDGMGFAAIGLELGIPGELAHKLYTDAIAGDQAGGHVATVHDLTTERTRRHGVV